MKISFVRGAYLNRYEGQNYQLPITGYSSLFPLDGNVPFPLVKLPSIADLQRIPLLEKPIKYIANRTLGDSQILFGLEKYIANSHIVHVADPHYYYSYQAAVMKEQGLIDKLVSTWWETIPFNNETTAPKKRIKNYVMKQVDKFLCYSSIAEKCLRQEGVPSEKIEVIPLGVDLDRFHPKGSYDVQDFTILFVGRLVEEKGILDLYSAFRALAYKYKNCKLKIIGSGELEKKIIANIQRDALQDRVLIQHSLYSEMPTHYQSAGVLCVPSKKTAIWEEQYGMVFVESMACGLPIVSTTTGAIPEIVQDAGLLGKEGDAYHIEQSLEILMSDNQLSSKIGTIGRERAENIFDSTKTAKKIQEFYSNL